MSESSQKNCPEFLSAARNLRILEEGVQVCLLNKLRMPAQILLFCWCDVIAAMTDKDAQRYWSTKSKTIEWIDRNVVPKLSVPVTGTEIYAARCGVLHGFTVESSEVKNGTCRRIAFTDLPEHAVNVAALLDRMKTAKFEHEPHAIVSIIEFMEVMSSATKNSLTAIQSDPEWTQKFIAFSEEQLDSFQVNPEIGASSKSSRDYHASPQD
ncbi:hypothetical protein ESB00_13880 [Oleiharenicola lentus]|uniref:Uncharacterized protein n=1 Tax=Oleiharenicola lentus TaxID=2508720 RepID=A0A4V1M5V2_9BACT|nr:hypothetical protein [Oleiharenicola lentus]RXK52806.1 hypothetical protein ESB00_13880 [Oleiharenicola lentus]